MPFHILTERVSIASAQMGAAQIGRIPKDAVEAAALDDFGECEEPVENGFSLGEGFGGGKALGFEGAEALKVFEVGAVGGDGGLVFRRFGEVKLGDGEVGGLAEGSGALGKVAEAFFFGGDFFGAAFG